MKNKLRFRPSGPYYLVGEITKAMAVKGHLPSGPIFITPALYEHIRRDHPELEAAGITAEVLVRDVMNNYSEIRKGSNDSFILVRRGLGNPRIAVIGLVVKKDERFNFWIGKTAWITNEKRVQRKPLALENKKPTIKVGKRSKR